MVFKIFNFEQDEKLIDSFLQSSSISHQINYSNTKEWFNWKFSIKSEEPSILACAIDNNQIIGCVGFGIEFLNYNGNLYKCGLSYETFVRDDYQGKGIFKKLIDLAEKEALKREIQILINFPNSNSLNGFLKMNWNQLEIIEYKIKIINYLKILSNFRNLKSKFIPYKNNYDEVVTELNIHKDVYYNEILFLNTSKDFLNWRFKEFPVNYYKYININDSLSIGRLGTRGKIIELQVLFKDDNINVRDIIRGFKKICEFDIISFNTSSNSNLNKELKRNLFLKVPSSSNMCYKILDSSIQINMEQLSLNNINYHTY